MQYKELADNKGRNCIQDNLINVLMRLDFPISQDILYKNCNIRTKVNTGFIKIIQSPSVASILKFEHVKTLYFITQKNLQYSLTLKLWCIHIYMLIFCAYNNLTRYFIIEIILHWYLTLRIFTA